MSFIKEYFSISCNVSASAQQNTRISVREINYGIKSVKNFWPQGSVLLGHGLVPVLFLIYPKVRGLLFFRHPLQSHCVEMSPFTFVWLQFRPGLARDRDGVIWEASVRLMECALQISLSHSIKHARPNNIITSCAVPFVFCQVIYPFHVSNIWTEYHNLKYVCGSVRTSKNDNLRSVQLCLPHLSFSRLYLSSIS